MAEGIVSGSMPLWEAVMGKNDDKETFETEEELNVLQQNPRLHTINHAGNHPVALGHALVLCHTSPGWPSHTPRTAHPASLPRLPL